MKEYSKNKKVILAAVLCVVVTFVAVVFIMAKISNTGTNRYFVWDRRVVDEEKTTAALVQHSPVKQDKVFTTDKPWEGDISDSFNIVDTGDLYIMYYSTYDTKDDVKICVAQSEDGIIWEKPCLNIVGFNGDKNNNILFDSSSGIISFFAFEDVNPKAANSKRYKAVALMEDNSIMTYTSADGISWKENKAVENISISSESKDVTLASAFWNKHSKKYFCYFSVYNNGKYEIMQSTSNNFKKWTESEKISFTSELDFSLRTANVIPYMRSDEMLIGFPMRITEIDKHDTDVNFDKDSAEDNRLTDALLISSVDGINFDVSGDAWIVPGPQHDSNWSYGDCFVANGIISTPSLHSDKGQDDELSVYVAENMFSDRGTSLARYTLRTDGFASYNAGFNTEKLVTKPLKITGSRMTVNFRTSTDGYVYVRVVDENGQLYKDIEYTLEGGTVYTVPEYTSYKMIGDRVDREVVFNGDFSKLKGKTAVIEFYMSDADVYSFSFDNEDYATENRWQPEEIEIREYGDFSYDVPENPVDIGTERQLFVDDYIIDKAKTDASLLLNSPVKKEELFKTDKPWEGNNCDFYVIVDDVDDEGIKYHRMYYLAWNSSDTSHDIRVCYAYSYDGVEWIKPELDILTYTDKNTGEVYTKTNILLCKEDVFDNFFVIKDTRPGVPASQRYKAIRQNEYDQLGYPSYGLWSWVSSDGLHWKKIHRLLPYIPGSWGTFDSLNTLVWDANTQQFFTYVRVKNQEIINGVDIPDFRKIYGATGDEFEPFDVSTVFALNYGVNVPLFELYTNNIFKYSRAPQMFMGIPTRFTRNFIWKKNYEYLTDPQARLEKFNTGQLTKTLSMTDAMFMTSRDGYTWNRVNEAFITPGPEYQANWIYGNCYPAYGLVETAADNPGEDNQLSTYIFEGKFYNEPSVMYRYVMRMDGFRSYKGNSGTQKVTTKPVTFTGSEMLLNFRTSAAGSVVISILDENGGIIDGYTSGRLIGDNTDRKVSFENDLSRLNGQTVIIEFVLTDAEIYSFKFQ